MTIAQSHALMEKHQLMVESFPRLHPFLANEEDATQDESEEPEPLWES